MISPTTSPQLFGINPSTSSSSSSSGPSQSLDENAFLTLLVAQLKHQDPTSPLQPYELAAQLAQFSTVEQLTQLNTEVQAQTDASKAAAAVSQTSLSASLLGRQVLATGNQVSVPLTGSVVTVGGGTHIHLVLASAPWPVGGRYISVVYVQAPGDAAPRHWRSTRGATIDYVPATTGTYQFVARVKDLETKTHSGDSSPLEITVRS